MDHSGHMMDHSAHMDHSMHNGGHDAHNTHAGHSMDMPGKENYFSPLFDLLSR